MIMEMVHHLQVVEDSLTIKTKRIIRERIYKYYNNSFVCFYNIFVDEYYVDFVSLLNNIYPIKERQ